jgi:ribonuclease E
LVTSDKDILPLARLARLRGTRTVVVGSDRTAVPLRRLADEYVTYRDLVAGTGVPVATHQRAGLVPLSRGQSEPRGPRLLPEPRQPVAPRPSTRRAPEPRRAPAAPAIPGSVAEAAPTNGPLLAARPPVEPAAPSEDAGAQTAAEAATASRRRRRRRGGRGTGTGEPGIIAGVSALEEASLSETAEIEMGGPLALGQSAESEMGGPLAPVEGDVLAEAAGAGASVLAQEAAAPAGATDAEALEEEVETPPPAPLPPLPPPRPVSPTGRLGFASFGSFDDPTPAFEPARAVEPEPIAPTDADRAIAAVGPVEVPPLSAALDAPPAEAESESEAAAAEPEGDVPTAAPARRRTRTPGRGRRARDQAEADAVATTEGTST